MVRDYLADPDYSDDNNVAVTGKRMGALQFIKEMEEDESLDDWHRHLIRAFYVMRDLARQNWPCNGIPFDRVFEERMK